MRILSVDLGTTNLKASVVKVGDSKLEVLESITERIPPEIPEPGAYEHNPKVVENLFAKVVKHLSVWRPEAVSLSTYLFGVVFVDEAGSPLTNIITWMDERPLEALGELRTYAGELYRRTGCPLIHIYALPKILWLKKARREVFARVKGVWDAKSYLMHRVIGEAFTDLSTASGTFQLLNIHTLRWDYLTLELAGIDEKALPKLLEGDSVIYLGDGARRLCLEAGTPFILGLYDGGTMIYGATRLARGERIAVVNLGTSAMLRSVVNVPVVDFRADLARFQTYYLLKGLWLSGGAVNNAGSAVEWVLRLLGYDESVFGRVLDDAGSVETDVIFVPLLLPERLPFIDPSARGLIANLRQYTARLEIVRAAIEGVTFLLKVFDEALADNGVRYDLAVAGGGLSKSSTVMKVLAGVLGKPVVRTGIDLHTLGHVMLTLEALGDRSTAKAIAEAATFERFEPVGVDRYRSKFSKFKELLDLIGVKMG